MKAATSGAGRRPRESSWLLLLHQLPLRPASLRVRVWRRLQTLGAVAIKNSAYVLPEGERAHEDLSWLLREIREEGGEAILCRIELLDGMTDRDVARLFRSAREAEYAEVESAAARLLEQLNRRKQGSRRGEARAQARRLAERASAVVALDFFAAPGRAGAQRAVRRLQSALERSAGSAPATPRASADADMHARGRTWVTRRGVHVDRISSAWLIRRFIDPEARFAFASGRGSGREGLVRFDMYEAEYTHVGDRCTFEVLLDAFGLHDPALRRIAGIVHDLDLKDDKFGHEEVAGFGRLLDGVVASQRTDERRLELGGVLLDQLYEGLRKGGSTSGRAAARPRVRRRRS